MGYLTTMTGIMAKEKGLIDEIGTYDELKNYIESTINDQLKYCH